METCIKCGKDTLEIIRALEEKKEGKVGIGFECTNCGHKEKIIIK